jgi:hypothetical protein
MLFAMVNRRIEVKDPLYRHLSTVVLPQAGLEVKGPAFESRRLSTRETVYLFEEKKTRVCFVGKFFGFRRKLTLLAHFFFQLHSCITGANHVNFGDDANYFQSIIESLARGRLLDTKTVSEFNHLCDHWEQTDEMWSAKRVLVHGDTTPTNFIFHPDALVISSDYGFRKPDPRMLHIALAMLNVQPAEAAYIGSSFETDLLCARSANLAVAGLIRQTDAQKQSYPLDSAADFVATDLREAFEWISANERS